MPSHARPSLSSSSALARARRRLTAWRLLKAQPGVTSALERPLVQRTLQRLTGQFWIPVDYRTSARDRPRWGHGRPSHARLTAVVEARRDSIAAELESFAGYDEDLMRIRGWPIETSDPFWSNGWFSGLDAVALYCFLRRRDPVRFVEIGSGHSTLFAARARADGGLRTQFTSIDPYPRATIDGLCDRCLRCGLEEVDLEVFDGLGAGDVLLLDGSHRVFQNSDATVFFLDILPRLQPGVLIGVDDVYLPADYAPECRIRRWSEQYLLACWLLAGARLEVILPGAFIAADAELRAVAEPLHSRLAPQGFVFSSSTFWLRTR